MYVTPGVIQKNYIFAHCMYVFLMILEIDTDYLNNIKWVVLLMETDCSM